MTYIIIHPNTKVLNKVLLSTISKHLEEGINSFEAISQDPDFCIVQQEGRSNIKIEQIKNLQKKLLYSPFNKTYQFGIIKDAHLMTSEAQNALLKTLEESQEKTILILTINSEDRVLKTILSRCIRIYPNEQNLEEDSYKFLEEIFFLKKTLSEKINHIEFVLSEKNEADFLDKLIKFFRLKHSEKLEHKENAKKEEEILKTLTQAKYRISKNVNTRIALEYICFKIDEYTKT